MCSVSSDVVCAFFEPLPICEEAEGWKGKGNTGQRT